ncbi:hypothetical protein AArcSl_2560 [Halalkaliarchaeum desulfuricum]|uniref:Uncharacterized protein n=1 Tax=Halalkaliarchaeum desulfuricum TaxID=2055893 RepID=A0A343TM58_9EURY|nr:DUF5798 family protein [Halalkaliarchaeum desulfuricum]AUX10180.1 hypothetical protein AArcSl_2560 [Halalkaliarchaeum desulfuricum]
MGLGGTAKKIQTLADTAEKMYQRLNELREQVQATQESVTDTTDRVKRLENEMAEQRALLNAVAAELDIDVETVSAEAHISDAEVAEETHEETPEGAAEETHEETPEGAAEETPGGASGDAPDGDGDREDPETASD